MCGRCNSTYYGETNRQLKVRYEEHIGIPYLTFKKTKPTKDSTICDHFLECNNIPSFGEFRPLLVENSVIVQRAHL